MEQPFLFLDRCRMHRLSQGFSIPFLALFLFVSYTTCAAAAESSDKVDVQALVRHVDNLWRGTTSHADMTMTVKTRHYQRKLTLEAWSRGMENSLVVIQAPIKDRGIATLKVGENIWNYLPKINRVTKIPPSMMSGSWMGSHFTNDDLVKENTFEADYNVSLTFSGMRDGQKIYEITALPKENAAVVWGKVVMDVIQSSLTPTRADYYDEDGKLIRRMTFSDFKKVDGKIVPMIMKLQPEDKPTESTLLEYNKIEFNVSVPQSFFSLQSLKRRH